MEKENKIKSKVEKYQEKYQVFEDYLDEKSEIEERESQIEDEIRQLEEQQKRFDYNDGKVVIGNMEHYIQHAIEDEKRNIGKKVNEALSYLTAENKKVSQNFRKVYELFSTKHVNKILNASPVGGGIEIGEGTLSEAEKATSLYVFFAVNKICSFVFRFDFLKFLPKVGNLPKAVRILIGVIVWGIVLLIISSTPIVAAGLLVLANILVYVGVRLLAKKYLLDNHIVYRARQNQDNFRKQLYDVWFAEFMDATVAGWRMEIENIKNNGVSSMDENDVDSLFCLARNDLKKEYMEYQKEIEYKGERLEEIQKEYEEKWEELNAVKEELHELEKEVEGFIGGEPSRNEGVLTLFVSTGFSIWYERDGVKKLSVINHNYHPVLISYSDETANSVDRFQKNVARLIELLMIGFFQENYDELISMKLIEFAGLHFPQSRTKGFMEVCHKSEELQNFYDELKECRKQIDSLPGGKIALINPKRLSEYENLIPYHIAYFVGVDFSAIDQETSQLFMIGENIGFLPFVFMRESVMDDFLKDNENSRPFSRVVRKMKDNNQIYEFEDLVDDFEMEQMVSDREQRMKEEACVKKILSFAELNDALDEGDLTIHGFLYVDAKEIKENDYQRCEKMTWSDGRDEDVARYIAFKDEEIPEFVNKDKVIWL